MKRVKKFFKKKLRQLKSLPGALKKLAAVSAAAFVVCMVVMGIMLPKINVERERFEQSSANERDLERQLLELNLKYYAEMIDKGFFDMTDSQGNSIWFTSIYPYILESMGYRVFIDGRIVTADASEGYKIPPYYKPNGLRTVVRIEEFSKQSNIVYNIPNETLVKFSYILTGGSGQPRDAAALVEVSAGSGAADYEISTISGKGNDNFISALEIAVSSTGEHAMFDIIIKDAKLVSMLGIFHSIIEVIHD